MKQTLLSWLWHVDFADLGEWTSQNRKKTPPWIFQIPLTNNGSQGQFLLYVPQSSFEHCNAQNNLLQIYTISLYSLLLLPHLIRGMRLVHGRDKNLVQ